MRKSYKTRTVNGGVLLEAMCCFFIFIPLALAGMDMVLVTQTAQANEEFAEQLARVCGTLTTKTNAVSACQQLIAQYQHGPHILSINLDDVNFDMAREKVTIATSMLVKLPVPIPGHDTQLVQARVTQPIVSVPADKVMNLAPTAQSSPSSLP